MLILSWVFTLDRLIWSICIDSMVKHNLYKVDNKLNINIGQSKQSVTITYYQFQKFWQVFLEKICVSVDNVFCSVLLHFSSSSTKTSPSLPSYFFPQASCSRPAERSRWGRVWEWMGNTISKSSPASYRCVCAVSIAHTHIVSQPQPFPQGLIRCLNVFDLLDLLRWDADWFP